MVFDITSTLRVVQSHLAASGNYAGPGVSGVMLGEPKAPPSGRRTASVFMDSVEVTGTTLTGTVEVHTVVIRVYVPQSVRPVKHREALIDGAVADIQEDVFEDFALGGAIRYADPDVWAVDTGDIEISGTGYRIADCSLSLIVDDSATFTA